VAGMSRSPAPGSSRREGSGINLFLEAVGFGLVTAAVIATWRNDFPDLVRQKTRARLQYPDMATLAWARIRCPRCGNVMWLSEVTWRHTGCPQNPDLDDIRFRIRPPDKMLQRRLPKELIPPEVAPTPALNDAATLRYVLRVLRLVEPVARERTYSERELQRVVAAVQKDVELLARETAYRLARNQAMQWATAEVEQNGVRCPRCRKRDVVGAPCPWCGATLGGLWSSVPKPLRGLLVPPSPNVLLPADVAGLLEPASRRARSPQEA